MNYTLATVLSFINKMIDVKSITWRGFKLVAADKDFRLTDKEILDEISCMRNDDDYFANVCNELIEYVPDISLSKYQKYLPDTLRKKMIADYVYDIQKTKEFIKDISIEIFKIC